MPPLTLLRTGAGSVVAPAVIRGLREAGARVVAADMRADAVGFAHADAAVRIPAADSADLIPALLTACRTERVDALFPDVDEEFAPIARARDEFARAGVRVLLSDEDALERCTDKLLFAAEMDRLGFPAPLTRRVEDWTDPAFPRFAKPRRGRGGAHAVAVSDPAGWEHAVRLVPDAIVQPLLPGPEFSVDTLSTLDGRFLYASVRERLLVRSGLSVRGRTASWPALEALAGRVVEAMGVIGPACLQCLLDAAGRPVFTDCNPRLGGGVVLSVEAGAPILGDIVRLLRGEGALGKVDYRAGLLMTREGDGPLADRFSDPLERVRAVTFDLDDTLYSRETHLHGALHAVAVAIARDTGRALDALESTLADAWRRLGGDHPRIFDDWLAAIGLDAEYVPVCIGAFHSFTPTTLTPWSGVADALAELRARGIPSAVVTDGCVTTQQAKLRALGLAEAVDEFVCCSIPKPDPQGLLEAASRLGVEPAAVLHVGDHPRYDVVMARRAGALSARVWCGEFATRPADPEASADMLCGDVAEIVQRVLRVRVR